jgi:Tfp pilus assembly protein PilW
MLMRALKNARLRLRSEHGFTLAELCVVMAMGIVVIIGLFTIMDVTLRQTQRTATKVDATRRARNALADIENELHSACVDGSPPIQGVTNGDPESDASNLVFISFYGTSATPIPTWHQITFNATAGALTDSSYSVTGSSQNWSQGTLVNTTTLLTNVAQISSTTPVLQTPVFQYYAYEPEYTDPSGNQYMMLPDGTNAIPTTGVTPISPANGTNPNAPLSTASGLSENDAGNAVEVVINLLVGASAGEDNSSVLTSENDPVTDAVSLRLTTPPNFVTAGTEDDYGPCQ